jgi:DNA-binding CsgD family transcriptional regulator
LDTKNALPGRVPALIDPIDIGWTCAKARDIYYAYYQNEIVQDPAAAAWCARHETVRFVTAIRKELVDDHAWYGAFCVSELRRFANVDDFVTSSIALAPGRLHGFVIYRPWGVSPFSARDLRAFRLFHLWLARMCQQSAKAAHPPEIAALSPRVRQALDLLVDGCSVKEVADGMRVKVSTVISYTKILHRRLGVQTRGQLLSKVSSMRRPGPLHLGPLS